MTSVTGRCDVASDMTSVTGRCDVASDMTGVKVLVL